ncbi:2OG-Fe(II) oxygenase family protein, partial [Trifolium pratense]
VEIVKTCRSLGLGPGGFYQPGYAGGAKLRLKMMCLGMDWDPQTRKYGYKRAIDGCKAPSIPHYFSNLVIRAIQEAHNLINQESGISYVEDILPSMTPDICIANFYETSGRLGLHQDRDESRESLRKGLPVVSFSIGDSAEFLYGDQRNVEKAESVFLESGDVLIFGGESRHVYHGVSSIIPNSAPEELLRDTCLCPGRLNLTFRQY